MTVKNRNYYQDIARQDATHAGIDPGFFVRQIQQESNFNPNAESPAGAIGIAQFMPATAREWNVDPRDPLSSLNGAARMMAHLKQEFGGDYTKALAAYNAGPGAVITAVKRGGVHWRNFLPEETQNYIRVITGE